MYEINLRAVNVKSSKKLICPKIEKCSRPSSKKYQTPFLNMTNLVFCSNICQLYVSLLFAVFFRLLLEILSNSILYYLSLFLLGSLNEQSVRVALVKIFLATHIIYFRDLNKHKRKKDLVL